VQKNQNKLMILADLCVLKINIEPAVLCSSDQFFFTWITMMADTNIYAVFYKGKGVAEV
jgi:hypothetical protein